MQRGDRHSGDGQLLSSARIPHAISRVANSAITYEIQDAREIIFI